MKSNENWRDSELAVRSIRKHGQRIIYVESQASSRGKGGGGGRGKQLKNDKSSVSI